MKLDCLCNWFGHKHDWHTCLSPASMYLMDDGITYQLCPNCVDAIEVYRIIRDAHYYARYYMGTS